MKLPRALYSDLPLLNLFCLLWLDHRRDLSSLMNSLKGHSFPFLADFLVNLIQYQHCLDYRHYQKGHYLRPFLRFLAHYFLKFLTIEGALIHIYFVFSLGFI